MSFKEAKRTFLTSEWIQDIFLLHVSSSLGQIKKLIKNEAHNLAGKYSVSSMSFKEAKSMFLTP